MKTEKPCKTCPFLINTKNFGRIDWVEDVHMLYNRGQVSHTCHVTDERADGYIGGEKRNCIGIKKLMENEKSGIHLHKNIFKNFKACLLTHLSSYKKDAI